jgi:hypothetical protein
VVRGRPRRLFPRRHALFAAPALAVKGALSRAQADIYHSQDPSLGTLLAMPRARHVVTLCDSADREDFAIGRRYGEGGLWGRAMHFLQVDNPLR